MKRFLTAVFYWANVCWIRLLVAVVSTRKVEGVENIPRKGALILVSNHLNNADPPLLTAALPRRVAWLTKAEWFGTPVVGTLFRMGGMVPIRRFEADLAGLRNAERALRGGVVLGMFPEGTRSKDKVLHAGEPGSALIALRTGAPVLPAAIWGTEDVKLPRALFGRTRGIHIRFGKPFHLPAPKRIRKDDVLAATETIMKEIAALLPEKYRGAYASPAGPAPAEKG